MTKPEFNLLDERWIRVVRPNCTEDEVSLTDALLRAHEYRDLCGEMATQNVAVLRLLLAVLHTVWSRVNANGEDEPLDSAEDAEARWKALWDLGHFPEAPIRAYLQKWRERFWLFHEERPFGQVPKVAGTEFGTKKLIASISESNNTVRLFSERSGQGKDKLTYAEAARWLVHINVFDDGALKKSKERDKSIALPPLALGYMGQLGVIAAQGENLFETLMLNMTMLQDGSSVWEEANCPIWEKPTIHMAERVNIAMPQNQAELLTVPFRRIKLEQKDGFVTGYKMLGGDFFQINNAFVEQMTVWKKQEKAGDKYFHPKRHNPLEQMWREFPACFHYEEDAKLPGVVSWVNYLARRKLIPNRLVTFHISSLQYNLDQAASKPIQDYFHDSLSFHVNLLTEVGAGWRIRIKEELGRCDQLAQETAALEEKLEKAAGGSSKHGNDVNALLYSRLDLPFRKWLYDIEPSAVGSKMEKTIDAWRDTARRIALKLGHEMVSEAGEKSYVGRYIEEDAEKGQRNRKVSVHYSSAEAYHDFTAVVYQIMSREGLKWQKK